MTAIQDSHRMFIQSFMSRGILNAQDVRSLFRKCCEQCNGNCCFFHRGWGCKPQSLERSSVQTYH